MPVTIKLTTMPGTKEQGPHYTTRTFDLFGPSLGLEQITVQRTDQVAAAVRAFGERVRAEHPDASFTILLRVAKGQRKPPGYDAAEKAGAFGEDAFMQVVEDRSTAFATIGAAKTSADAPAQETPQRAASRARSAKRARPCRRSATSATLRWAQPSSSIAAGMVGFRRRPRAHPTASTPGCRDHRPKTKSQP